MLIMIIYIGYFHIFQTLYSCWWPHVSGSTLPPPEEEVVNIFSRIRESQNFQQGDIETTSKEEPSQIDVVLAEQKARATAQDLDPPSKDVAESMLEVLQPGDASKDDFQQFFPKQGMDTLHGCLKNHDTFEGAKVNLWKLACFLRIGNQGMDSPVVPNHLLTRNLVLTKISKWHNLLRHQVSVMEAHTTAPACRQRASRAAAWAEHQEELRLKNMPGLPKTMQIETGDTVAVLMGSRWNVALVLSIYRIFKKGAGAQLFAHELAKGGLHSARVVIMEESDSERCTGEFRCGANSLALVLPADKIGIKLDTASSQKVTGIDGQKIVLGEDRFWWACFFFKIKTLFG